MHHIDIRNLSLPAGQLCLTVPHLRFDQGKTCCVIGKSGSGKSLLAGALSGVPMPGLTVTGDICLDGRKQVDPLWKEHVFLLPQEPATTLDPTMSIGKQVAEIFRWRFDPACRWNTPMALCAQVGLSAADLDKHPGQVSGGMQQRVMIAMALAARASFVVADEPTKGLDAQNRSRVIDLFKLIQAAGRGLIMITHDLNVVRALADSVVVLDRGEVVEQGAGGDMLRHPRSTAAKTLIESEPANWPAQAQVESLAAAPRLSLIGVTFGFSGAPDLIKDANLDLRRGDIVGIYGPSGVGKSTLGDLCIGLHAPRTGAIHWNGAPLTRTVCRQERARFQKLFQNPVTSFPPNLTVGEVFDKLTPAPRDARLSPERLMARLGVSHALLNRRPAQVSGGELQRLAIIRVLMAQPTFLVCDEPSSRLDMSIQRAAIDIIADYVSDSSAAALLISHDLSILQKRASRVFELSANGILLPKSVDDQPASPAGQCMAASVTRAASQ